MCQQHLEHPGAARPDKLGAAAHPGARSMTASTLVAGVSGCHGSIPYHLLWATWVCRISMLGLRY